MALKYFALLTNIGAAKLSNMAALGEKLDITSLAVGDGGGVSPTPNQAQTKLINEVRRAQLNSLSVDKDNDSQIIAEQIIPESAGGWWIREIGLFDADGDLIAIANCPETYKATTEEGSGRTQVIRMLLTVSSTDAVTLKVDPSVVLATRQYVDDAVIEVKAYTDKVMKDHEGKANPHSQYPLIANALKEMADAGLVAKVLENLRLQDSNRGIQGSVIFSTAGISNWNVPDVVKNGRRVKATVVGGGGAGGRAVAGGGGGGGGFASKLVDLTGVSSVTITVGAGGIPAALGTSTASGGAGGSSSFGGYLSATGGDGGSTPSAGKGGTGVGGTLNTSLGPGCAGAMGSAYCSGSGGGAGGPGSVSSSVNNGTNAIGFGGGGSGAAQGSDTSVSCIAGAGKPGYVLIEW